MAKRPLETILYDLCKVEEDLKRSKRKRRRVLLAQEKKRLELEMAIHPDYDPFLASESTDVRWWQV